MLFNYIFATVLCYTSEVLTYLVGLIDFGLSYEMKNQAVIFEVQATII